jgi:hypothetical protein
MTVSAGGTQNRDFDCRGLLVNIDNHIIPLRDTECERQSSHTGAACVQFRFLASESLLPAHPLSDHFARL